MSSRAAKPFQLTGWHVLLILVVFFGVVIAVNVGFIVQAYSTFPGEVTARPYEEGLQFNRTLAKRAEERALGWRATVQATMAQVGRTQLRVTVMGADGKPVRGLVLSGRLERPATEAGALTAAFHETGAGLYDAYLPDTPGAWDLTLRGTDRGGQPFEARRRMVWR